MNRDTSTKADLEKVRRHERILLDLGQLAMQRQPLDAFLNQVVSLVARAVEINHVKVMRYRPEQGDLLMLAGIGWKPGSVGHATFSVDLASPPGRAYRTGQPVIIDDLRDADDYRPSRMLEEHGIVSLLNVPILIERAAWGVLEVDSTVQRDFTADTAIFMQTAAIIVAGAIQRMQTDDAYAASVARVASEAQRHEIVLKEMQHRVQNYFQLILSMLTVERPRLPTEAGRSIIDRIAERILAVSLAHNQLSPTQDMKVVNLPTYLRAICTSIDAQVENVAIDVQADELDLPVDRAVPLGLIVNELVTNSIKHAFNGKGGAVTVAVRSGTNHGAAEVVVADNGKGIDEARPGGSGLKLVNALARQVGAEVSQESGKQGTRTIVSFSVPA